MQPLPDSLHNTALCKEYAFSLESFRRISPWRAPRVAVLSGRRVAFSIFAPESCREILSSLRLSATFMFLVTFQGDTTQICMPLRAHFFAWARELGTMETTVTY